MLNQPELLATVRRAQKKLQRQAVRFLWQHLFQKPVRHTRHFREWYRCPMNYARIMELPLTMLMLEAKKDESILDVSSPKLLALCYTLWGYKEVVAADMEDYFISDFTAFVEHAGLKIKTAVFDATDHIPFPNDYFDKIFSVSVVEHIPGDGDTCAIRQMLRVLKRTGTLVITLPAYPTYMEEWVSASTFYWRSRVNDEGRTFYQRRYDREALHARLSVDGGTIDDIVLIAEKPVAEPRFDISGMLLHNSYYIDHAPLAKYLVALASRLRLIPLVRYLAEDIVSRRCHYLTTDWSDPNIRQVVVKIRKSELSRPEGLSH